MSDKEHSGADSEDFEDSELSANTTKKKFDFGFKCNLKALAKAVESVETERKNPVAALNELGLGESYRLLKQSGHDHCLIFTVAVTVADMTFEGCGHRKTVAKASAARKCLHSLLARAGSNPEPEPDFTSHEMYPDSELSANTTKKKFDFGFKCNLKALAKAVESVETEKKNPVAALNELGLGESYRLLKQSGHDHCLIFTVAVTVADMTFEGCGHRKTVAKASAARKCLHSLLARAGSNPEPEPDFTSHEMYPGSGFQCFEAKIQPPEVNDKKASPPRAENYLDSQGTGAVRNIYDKAELAENIVADMTFEGCGHRKTVAKASAARKCLHSLLAHAGSNPEPEPDFTSDEMYPGSGFLCFEAKIQPPEVNDKKASPPRAENYLDSQGTGAVRNIYDKAELAENIKRSYLHGASNDAPQQAVPPTNSIVTDNDEDTKIADEMFSQLKRRGSDTSMNHFKVVIHPNTFSLTTENIHHLCCLVDGRMTVFIDDDGTPVMQTEQ